MSFVEGSTRSPASKKCKLEENAAFRVLISGLGGVGVEIAKSIIVGGAVSVTLHDNLPCKASDWSSQLYVSEANLGKNRAEISHTALKELNQHTEVEVLIGDLNKDCLEKYQVVVLTNSNLEEQLMVSEIVRSFGNALIVSKTHGLFGQVFSYYGENFKISSSTENIPSTSTDYVSGNRVQFKPLAEALVEPEFSSTAFCNLKNSYQLHLAFRTLDAYVKKEGRLPAPWNRLDGLRFVELAKQINLTLKGSSKVEKIDDVFLATFSHVCQGNLCPLNSVLGGIVAHEVMKACCNQLSPMMQWLYVDASECLPSNCDSLTEEICKPTGSRYDGQVAVFGNKFQEKLGSQCFFVIGAGVVGCELLKNFAMIGVGAGKGGCVYITDPKLIEETNLQGQFLFRSDDLLKPKSNVAAAAAKKINPLANVTAFQDRVGQDAQKIFNRFSFSNLDGVATTFDDVDVSLYMDRRCSFYCKPLFDSRIVGKQGSVQVVIPNLTESYSSSQTLKNFVGCRGSKLVSGKNLRDSSVAPVISGFICMEFWKLVQDHAQLEVYKNIFVDLALPLYVSSVPTAKRPTKKHQSKFLTAMNASLSTRYCDAVKHILKYFCKNPENYAIRNVHDFASRVENGDQELTDGVIFQTGLYILALLDSNPLEFDPVGNSQKVFKISSTTLQSLFIILFETSFIEQESKIDHNPLTFGTLMFILQFTFSHKSNNFRNGVGSYLLYPFRSYDHLFQLIILLMTMKKSLRESAEFKGVLAANVETERYWGKSLLEKACCSEKMSENMLKLIQLLLEIGADPNSVDGSGDTPLHHLFYTECELAPWCRTKFSLWTPTRAETFCDTVRAFCCANYHFDQINNRGKNAFDRFKFKRGAYGRSLLTKYPYKGLRGLFTEIDNKVLPLSCLCSRVIQKNKIEFRVECLPLTVQRSVRFHPSN